MNFGSWLKEYYPESKRQRWGFCEGFMVWYLVTKCVTVKFAKPWMSRHLSTKSRDPSYVRSAICPECPTKTGEASPDGYSHGKAAQSSSKDQVAWLHLQPCLVPSWCGAKRTIWDCCWVLLELLSPRPSPEEKRAWKWKWMNEKQRKANAAHRRVSHFENAILQALPNAQWDRCLCGSVVQIMINMMLKKMKRRVIFFLKKDMILSLYHCLPGA